MRIFILFTFLLTFQAIKAIDPRLEWKTIDTDNFIIHFPETALEQASELVLIAEQHHLNLVKQLNWTPIEKTRLVLTDHTDFANGYASPLPFNRSVLFLQPPKAGRLEFSNWLYSLLLHEYVHVLHLDRAADIPNNLRSILGRFWPLFPNTFQPSWLIEGLATYYESLEGQGRGNSSMFELMMRAELQSGLKSLSEVNMASPSWPLNARYLYGYYFFEFVEQEYGREYIEKLLNSYSNNWLPFALNTSANEVFNKDLDILWKEFESYLENKWQLDKSNLSVTKPITQTHFFKYAAEYDNRSQLWFVDNNGYTRTSLNIISNDKQSKVTTLNGPTRLDYREGSGLLIAQPEVCDEFNTYYDLYHLDTTSKKLRRLTNCSRYQEAQWLPNNQGIVALKYQLGRAQLDLLSTDGEFRDTLLYFDDKVVSDIDLSDDGHKLLASIQVGDDPSARLALIDIKKLDWYFLTEKGVQSWHGRFINNAEIFYSSDRRKGYFDLYSMTLNNKTHRRITEAEFGLFQPTYDSKGGVLIAAEYSDKGYDYVAVEIESNNQRFIDLENFKFNETNFTTKDVTNKNATVKVDSYSALKSLTPTFWTPFLVGNDNTQEFGIQTAGMDALEQHNYIAGLSVEFERSLVNAFLQYQMDYRLDVLLENYYDIIDDGNTATSDFVEQSSFAQAIYRFANTSRLDRWTFEVGIMQDNLRQYVGFEDDLTFIRELNDSAAGLVLNYDSTTVLSRSISRSDGRQVKWSVVDNNIIDSSFHGKRSVLDWREYIPITGEQVLVARGLVASAERGSPNFRLSGDDLDSFNIRSFRLIDDKFRLRGYPDFSPLLTGRHIRMTSMEWRFPITHIERTFMVPPIGIEEISMNIFTESARVYGQSETTQQIFSAENVSDRIYSSYGLELNLESRLGYFMPLNLQLGYANIDDRLVDDDKLYFQFNLRF